IAAAERRPLHIAQRDRATEVDDVRRNREQNAFYGNAGIEIASDSGCAADLFGRVAAAGGDPPGLRLMLRRSARPGNLARRNRRCNAHMKVAERGQRHAQREVVTQAFAGKVVQSRSEEHTSELQSLTNIVCRLLLEKKKPD